MPRTRTVKPLVAPPPGASQALAHLRICDLSGQLAGAGATRFLAAFGAQVIRVEDPVRQGRWDILRGSMPFVDERRGLEVGGAFNNHNVEKLGVTINLRTERGKDLLRKLVAASDVVTENFAAGVMARLGFSYEALRQIREDIIYVSNSGFGATGPYESFKTFGPVVQAMCGLTFSSGLRDQAPAGWGLAYMDHMGAAFMAMGLLAAVAHRNRTGEGQWVDMSCTEAGLTLAGPDLLDYTANGRPLRRPGMPDSNRSHDPAMAPHGIYPTAAEDRWVAVACRDDADWERLRGRIDDAWAHEARWATLAGRIEHQDVLDEQLAAWTVRQDRDALAADLRRAGVPASVVALPEDRIEHDPMTSEWGLWPTVHHPEIGDVRVDGLGIHLSETDWAMRRGAPLLGEHNQEVFAGILGLDQAEIDQLAKDGDT
ncbi:MAG: L-carnitine dehydratase/bile acid-inducible protein [Actinomycetia bacterium]|nr:L-carnitine dehydratase/bile acid-inducible protein [Actinomycetes bacterium]